MTAPLWITEAEVVALMHLGEAIDALEDGLRQMDAGSAITMEKTHVTWGGGHTLHAIGAVMQGAGLVGTKTWAHTAGGATPLLQVWNEATGALEAIIEAFALGQMRTGAMSGVATRWMAAPEADAMAVIGTGKQAITQVAAVHAVRPLRTLRVFSPTPGKRAAFAEKVARRFPIAVEVSDSVEAAVADMPLVTLVTRARDPFLSQAMLARGAHVNAVGAIAPEREEFSQDLFPRVDLIAADNPKTALALNREFQRRFAEGPGDPACVRPIGALVAAGEGRAAGTDLSLFKAMGMGVSDMALGAAILERARAAGKGRPLAVPTKVQPRLGPDDSQ